MAQPPLSARGLRFDNEVPQDGYQWWYVDAFSDDGDIGLTVIAFIGSVFSPYYAAARRRGEGDPANFCSLNVIFYEPRRKRWALTERGRGELDRGAHHFSVGPSGLRFDGSRLTISVDEWCVPWPSKLRGEIRVDLPQLNDQCFALDGPGQHRWWPACPAASVDVQMDAPQMRWQGRGYLDVNAGVVPLEQSFQGWHWLRADTADGGYIDYDTREVTGEQRVLKIEHNDRGEITRADADADVVSKAIAATAVWRMGREVSAAAAGLTPATLEDTPFYARSSLTGRDAGGHDVQAMHESLDMQRFQRRWVQTLLPFRMPRRAGW